MKKFDASYNLFGLSFCAGEIYILVTIFRGRYDAVNALHLGVFGGLGVLIYALGKRTGKRTPRGERLANILMILWAVLAILILHGNIGWTIYFTTLVIIPNLVCIWMRLTKTRENPGT